MIEKGLKSYENIMRAFDDADVSKDRDFQRKFTGFYRVRRNESWRKEYYDFFQQVRNKEVSFKEIIEHIEKATGNIEASFSSKMLATINPNFPIWDQYVLANLGLKPMGLYRSNRERLVNSIELYSKIALWYKNYIQSEEGKKDIEIFDAKFSKYSWLSSTKKIDFMLWSKR